MPLETRVEQDSSSQKNRNIPKTVKQFVDQLFLKDIHFIDKYLRNRGGYAKNDPQNKANIYYQFGEFLVEQGVSDYTSILATVERYDLFLKEILLTKERLEATKDSLLYWFTKDYTLDAGQKARIQSEIENLPFKKISELDKSDVKRKALLERIFGVQNIPNRQDATLPPLFRGLANSLSQVQKARILTQFRQSGNGGMTGTFVRDIIALSTNPEQKKAIIEAFMPHASLQKYIDFGFLDKDQLETGYKEKFKNQIKEFLRARNINQSQEEANRLLEDFMEKLDFSTIFVSFSSIADQIIPDRATEEKFLSFAEARFEEWWDMVLEWDGDMPEDHDENIDPLEFKELSSNDIRQYLGTAWSMIRKTNQRQKIEDRIEGVDMLQNEEFYTNRYPLYFRLFRKNSETNETQKILFRVSGWKKHKKTIIAKCEILNERWIPEGQEYITLGQFQNIIGDAHGAIQTEEEYRREFNVNRPIQEIINNHETLSFAEVTEKIDICDSSKKDIKIEGGMSFTIGSGGNLNVATLLEIRNHSVTLRNPLGGIEEISFERFVELFELESATRLEHSLATPDGFLKLRKFDDLGFDEEKNSFVDTTKEESKREEVRYFEGTDGNGFEIEHIDGNQVRFRAFEKFKKGEKLGDPTVSFSAGPWVTRPLETIYLLAEKFKVKPYAGKKVPTMTDVPFEQSGGFSRYLAWASLKDFIGIPKRYVDFFKEKMEERSKANTARLALSIGSSLGLPDEMVTEFRARVNSEWKKQLTTEIERLNDNYTTSERQNIVKKYLADKSSSPERIIACTCSILGKHGNLYPGSLSEYEGKWLFFQRLPGTAKEKQAWLYERGDIQEEFAIFLWLKKLAEETPPRINPFYWGQIKKYWDSGAKEQLSDGEDESERKTTMEKRMEHASGKLMGEEFGHAVGAMEKGWNKVSNNFTERMRLPFVIAMSNARDQMHGSVIQRFANAYKNGAFYAPLLFVDKKENQELFRRVMTKIVSSSGNAKMISDYVEIKDLINQEAKDIDNQKLLKKLNTFWVDHGKSLYKKLSITIEDPEIFLKKDTDPDFQKYYAVVKDILGEWVKPNDAEIDSGAYGVEGGIGWTLIHPAGFIKQVEFNSGPGTLMKAEVGEPLMKIVEETFEKIRNQPPGNTPEAIASRKKLYANIHKALLNHIHLRLNHENWEMTADGKRKIQKNWPLFGRFAKYGIDVWWDTKEDGDKALRSDDTYAPWLDRDFARFEQGQSAQATQNMTRASIHDILNLGWNTGRPAAANNSNIRQRA